MPVVAGVPRNLNYYFFIALVISLSVLDTAEAIQCYSGSQLQILECPSVSCIKQSLGLDTVRYCDGTAMSSICQTYRIFDSCQNIPNLGYICCCSEQLCNDTPAIRISTVLIPLLAIFTLSRWFL